MAIAQHQATLEILSIDFGKRSECIWTADDISSVTQTCIKLRQLSLVMGQIDLSSGGPSFFRRWNKPFDHQTALYVTLRKIAVLTNLVTLHLRRLPEVSLTHAKSYPENHYMSDYQEAELRRLKEACMTQCFSGSHLRVMAWGGEEICGLRTNLHDCEVWSNMLCCTKEELTDSRGSRQAIAMKTKKEKLKYVEPEVDVLGVAFQQTI
ncbi:hypothetical protein LTS14_008164 [Recurvomyces mirabilis]|nr:hypothetical protein LTS14_008164 [Recurvomyces mirabilis]